MIENVAAWDRAHLWRFRGRLFAPVDGDTFVLLPDCGFRVAGLPHIRLLDYSAPERYQWGGPEATARLTMALTSNGALWPLRIESTMRETVVTETKTFDRYVARVWVVRPDGITALDVRDMLHAD